MQINKMRYLLIVTSGLLFFISSQNSVAQQVRIVHPLSKSILVTLDGGGNYAFSDYENSDFGINLGGSIEYYFPTNSMHIFGTKLSFAHLNLSGSNNNLGLPEIYDTQIMKLGAGLTYSYAVNSRMIPFGYLGTSYLWLSYDNENIKSTFLDIENGGENTSILLETIIYQTII